MMISFLRRHGSPKTLTKQINYIRRVGIVTQSQVDEFQENGVICLRKVFDKHWVTLVTQGIKRNRLFPGPRSEISLDDEGRQSFDDFGSYQRIREYMDFVVSSPAAEITGKLMKSTVSN